MIHINQVGYRSNMLKKAVITGGGERCFVVSASGDVVCEPELTAPRPDAASGDTVRVADFSQVKEPGEYFLFSDGEMKAFHISNKPYRALVAALLKGMYYQRCGCVLDEKHAGPYRHGVCHTGLAKLVHDDGVALDVRGGWHDAGDYGRYVSPGAVTLGHLLYAYELFPDAFRDTINIPESGNGTPDILNECRYELEWMMKMQREDGGLYHKVATRYFAPFIMPEDDKEELLLFRVTHTSTAAFAGACAGASRAFRAFDAVFADKLLHASVRAWEWMGANPVFEPFSNPPHTSSGAYGDDNCMDEHFWASCELYAATGEGRYYSAMCELADKVDIKGLGWRDVGGLGAMCCLFALPDKDSPFIKKLRERFIAAADNYHMQGKWSGYGTVISPDDYVWGSNLPILSGAIILICAKLLTGEDAYKDAAQEQLDYLLGKNATGYSFVTGFGEGSVRYPHHRPSYADGVGDPVPGLVSGGPNNKYPDKSGKGLIPADTPPAKYFIDHTWSAPLNENAIYWNSPAIFVAAYFDMESRAGEYKAAVET